MSEEIFQLKSNGMQNSTKQVSFPSCSDFKVMKFNYLFGKRINSLDSKFNMPRTIFTAFSTCGIQPNLHLQSKKIIVCLNSDI